MPASDKFSGYNPLLGDPCDYAFVITPANAEFQGQMPRAIYVGNQGNISAIMRDGSTVVFQNAPAGSVLPIRVRGINSTGTTATGLVGIY
jgi:hypothetical protein